MRAQHYPPHRRRPRRRRRRPPPTRGDKLGEWWQCGDQVSDRKHNHVVFALEKFANHPWRTTMDKAEVFFVPALIDYVSSKSIATCTCTCPCHVHCRHTPKRPHPCTLAWVGARAAAAAAAVARPASTRRPFTGGSDTGVLNRLPTTTTPPLSRACASRWAVQRPQQRRVRR